MREFEEIVWNFQKELPVEKQPRLTDEINYIYNGSVGCIGILKDWLYRALSKALNEKSETVTKEHLEYTKLEPPKLLKILNECIDGEKKIREEKAESANDLNDLLNGIIKLPDGKVIHKKDSPSHSKSNVGIRKPMRDPVGQIRNNAGNF
jgi:hypothetical protein